MIYLIDLENVNDSGFIGIENLTENDKIVIFYSLNSCKVSMTTHFQLESTKAKKEYKGVKVGGKNALDFQLSTYLGYLVATEKNTDFAIVSKDEGFNFVVDFWEKEDIKITRCENLNGLTKENVEKELKSELKKILLESIPNIEVDFDNIYSIISKYKTKQGINNALTKEYGSERTGAIYKIIRPYIKDKKGR